MTGEIRNTGLPPPAADFGRPIDGGAAAGAGTAVNRAAATGPLHAAAQAAVLTVSGPPAGTVAGMPGMAAPPLGAAMMDPDTANVLVAGLLDKVTTEDMRNLMSQLKDASKRLDSVNSEKLKKYAEKMHKAVEEAKKQREAKVSGDVGFGLSMAGAVLGMVGAVLLTVFTFGGGAAAIAGAAIGLAATIMDGADRIAKEQNLQDSGINKGKQMDLTLGGLVSRLAQEITASQPGFSKLPPDQKEKVLADLKQVVQIVVTIMIAAGTIAAGGASISQIGKTAGKTAEELSKFVIQQGARLASQGAESLQVVADVAGGVNSIASGAYGVQIANITFEKNDLDNQRQKLDTFADVIKKDVASYQDALSERMQSISSIYENLATANANYYDSQSRMTRMN